MSAKYPVFKGHKTNDTETRNPPTNNAKNPCLFQDDQEVTKKNAKPTLDLTAILF